MGVDLDLVAYDPDLQPLWDSLHERLSSGTASASISSVSVPNLPPAGVATLRSWIDGTSTSRRTAVKSTQRGTTIPVRHLLSRLGIGSDELAAFVERATGRPLTDRAASRRQALSLRSQLWGYAQIRLEPYPRLVSQLRTVGLSGEDDTSMRHLIDALAEALGWISANPGPISLAKLAHDITGDPHYFDLKDITGSRLVAGVAELQNQVPPVRPDLVRAFLASTGIIADRLSSTVLLHNVMTIGDGPIDRRLTDSANPVALTYLDITSTPPTFAPQILTVVENPSVLEAAMASNARHAFACTSGRLGHVDHALLQLAVDQGLDLRYSGDLDTAGHEIAQTVAGLYGAALVGMGEETATRAAGWRPVVDAPRLAEAAPVVYQEHDLVLKQVLASPPGSRSQA